MRLLGYGMLGTSVLAAGLLAWGLRVDDLRQRHLDDFKAEAAAHKATVANYRAAAKVAQDLADARVRKGRDDEKAANKEATDALRADLADTDVAYRRLLRQLEAARAHSGNSDEAGMPGAVLPGCFADGTPCSPEILATLKAAEDQAAQLVRLQDAIRDYRQRQGEGAP